MGRIKKEAQIRKEWHTLTGEEVISLLDSHPKGLSSEEAKKRRLKQGPNLLSQERKASLFSIFLRQLANPMVYILFGALFIKFMISSYLDGFAILGIIFIIIVVGFIQEAKANRAVEALKQLSSPKAKVWRDGRLIILPSEEIVVGDILLLETGDKVPADARLLESSSLKVSEAILTGESMPVEKHTHPLTQKISLSEKNNLVFMGTTIAYGKASAVVCHTGDETEIGKIAASIRQIPKEITPLQRNVHILGNWILLLIFLALSIFIFIGIHKGLSLLEIASLGVSAAIAALPEGLPAAVTVILAIGMSVMAKKNAIIRRMTAVETLGSVTLICSDKTGTLTQNKMTVRTLYADGVFFDAEKLKTPLNPSLLQALKIATLCNDALLTEDNGNINMIGDPTEGALLFSAKNAGIHKEEWEERFPRLDEIPFQSEKQYMVTAHSLKNKNERDAGRNPSLSREGQGQDKKNVEKSLTVEESPPYQGGVLQLYIKGSPEKIISFSQFILKNGEILPLTSLEKENILDAFDRMTEEGQRVLAVGYCDYTEEGLSEERIKGKIIFTALFGLMDPPRENAIHAIAQCRKAGVKVVMITGDNPKTAQAISKEMGFEKGLTLTGQELELLNDDQLTEKLPHITFFARIEPLHKLRIVRLYKKLGHVVAMTGDGVNDAPALEQADIGISMGITGTEVAKEASDMILADDDFTSIELAIEEGRALFNRLRNVVSFLLTTCFGELFCLILSVFFTASSPLTPLQILWINLLTGGIVAIPLGMEPKTGEELSYPPRSKRVGLIFPGMILKVTFSALALGLGAFLIFFLTKKEHSLEHARTMVFTSIVIFEWLLAFNNRSDELSIFRQGVFKNRWLVKAVTFSFFLQLLVIYFPPFQTLFKTTPISFDQWMIVLLPGTIIFILESLRKSFFPTLFNWGKWK